LAAHDRAHTWYGRFPRQARFEQPPVFDEMADNRSDEGLDPEALMIQQQAVDRVRRAIEELPTDFREVIVLSELEGMSYKEIAAIVGIRIGTVMSRLTRGRERLLIILKSSATTEVHRDVS
jgi:RNA polymerase sigma factor (sigma-70 family)